jgi:hypothetical protein
MASASASVPASAGESPFVGLLRELLELKGAIAMEPADGQAYDSAAAGGLTLRDALNLSAGKLSHELIRCTLVLRSATVDLPSIVGVLPTLTEGAGHFVSAVQLLTAAGACSAALRSDVRTAAGSILMGLVEMFRPLASIPAAPPSALRSGCARHADAVLRNAGQIDKLCEAVLRLPPDDLQALRRALLSCGKLVKASLAEVAEEQGLLADRAFDPLSYRLPAVGGSAAAAGVLRAGSDEGDAGAAAALAGAEEAGAGAGAGARPSPAHAAAPGAGAGTGAAGVEPDGDDGDEDGDDFDDEEEEEERLPAARQAVFARCGVVALHSLFAGVKASQAAVDRVGAACKAAQARKAAAAAVTSGADSSDAGEASSSSGSAASPAAATALTQPLPWMDAAHAAFAALQDAVIDVAASVNDYSATPEGLRELREASEACAAASARMLQLVAASAHVAAAPTASGASGRAARPSIPPHDAVAEAAAAAAWTRARDALAAAVGVAAGELAVAASGAGRA